MQNFKIGKNAIHIVWAINDINGNPRDLSRLIPSVFYACGGGRVEAQYVEVKGNIISWTFPAREQKIAGTYALSLVLKNLDGTEYSRLYRAEAFTLTPLRANDTIMAVQTESEQNVYLTACMTLADTSNKADLFYVDNRLEQVEANAREYADAAVAGHIVIFNGTNSFTEIKDAIQRDIPIIARFPAGTNIGGITIDTAQMAAATTKMDDVDVISLRFVFCEGYSFFQATYDAGEDDIWTVTSDYLATRDDLASKPDIFILSSDSTSEEVRNAINKKMFIAVASNRPDTDGGYLFADYAKIHTDGAPMVFFHYITNQTVYELEYYYDISTSDGDWRISEKEYTILASKDIPIEKGEASGSIVQKTRSSAENKAISENSVALGSLNIAGTKAYKWSTIDFSTKTITLVDTPSGIAANDRLSIVNKNHYDDCCKVVSVNGKNIIVDSLPFTAIETDNGEDAKTIFVVSKPNVGNVDLGQCAFAEGGNTMATQMFSHAEGYGTKAIGQYSHAEGRETEAVYAAHAEGQGTKALGTRSHAEGYFTEARSNHSHAEGYYTVAESDVKTEPCHAEGAYTQALSRGAHAEGCGIEDNPNIASGMYSHVEGRICDAEGHSSHAEGHATLASGKYSHSQNDTTIAEGESSHAEGINTKAKGKASHAQGQGTQNIMVPVGNRVSFLAKKYEGGSAIGENSSVSGLDCAAIGNCSFANGYRSVAYGGNSFANGQDVITRNGSEVAFGRNNYSHKNSETWGDAGNTVFSIGVSDNFNYETNGFEVMQNGDVYVKGVGNYQGNNPVSATSLANFINSIKSDLSNLSFNYAMDKETIEGQMSELDSLARGAQRALVYTDYSKLVTALNAGMVGTDVLPKGQSIYIQQLDVPDLWVSNFRAPDELTEYTYTNDEDFLEYIKGGGWIGCHQLSLLETAKVDLSNTASKAEVTALQAEVAALKAIINEITTKE